MRSSGQVRSRRSASSAQAATRCSQLSSTSSRCMGPSRSARTWLCARPGCSVIPRATATVCGTSCGSARAASSTSQAPSAYSGKTASATCKARRVLPTPPGPVSVSRGLQPSRRRSSAKSRSRPMKLVSWYGRLWPGRCGAGGSVGVGSAVGAPARRLAPSSIARSGSGRSSASPNRRIVAR
jgi:hypothetical protein